MEELMIRRPFSILKLMIPLMLFAVIPLFSQDNNDGLEALRESAPRVFLDCNHCDRDFFRDSITYVNFVRDRMDADIHILITEQNTGSGGREYTFAFIGLGEFEDIDHTMVHASGPTDTRDEVRRGQLDVLEKGIFPFLVETPLCEYMSVSFQKRLKPTAVKDPWKFWVFSISADARFRGESSQQSSSMDLNVSANKVTPKIKVRLGLSGEFDYDKYDYEDEVITSRQDEKDFSGLVVKSISDHWSIGGWVEAESSTYGNVDLHFTLAPALEYNFFPYADSTRRQLLMRYRIGWNSIDYIEETIFNKKKESLLNESLTIALELRQPWGNISTSLEGSHYFSDFKKNRLELGGSIDVRLFKGFSVEVRGRYDMIRDQLNLPKEEASLDEVLLQRKELATNYDYSISVGFRYTFGSVFSNVVNPRFGGTRRYYR
jgi:hypothetical protein